MKSGKGWLWKVGIGVFVLAMAGVVANAGVISAGYKDSFGVKADNSLWGWGYNDDTYSMHLLTQDVAVAEAQLGLGPTNTMVNGEYVASPTQSGTAKTWVDVVGGESHGFGIQSDGSLLGWGYDGDPAETYLGYAHFHINHYEQGGALGMGAQLCQVISLVYTNPVVLVETNTPVDVSGTIVVTTTTDLGIFTNSVMNGLTVDRPTQVGTAKTWSQVAAGDNFGLGLQDDGSIWSWGSESMTATLTNPVGYGYGYVYNANGQLGQGDMLVTVTNVVAGYSQSELNQYYTNNGGATNILYLTTTNITTYSTSTNVAHYVRSLNTPTKITAPTSMVNVAAGYNYSAAIGSDGSLRTWGKNHGCAYAVSVSVSNSPFFSGYIHRLILSYNTNLMLGSGDATLIATNVPARVGSETTWASVSAGMIAEFTLAIKKDGSLWGWGNNGAQRTYYWPNGSTEYFDTNSVATNSYVFRTYAYGYLGLGSNVLAATTPTRVGTDNNWAMVSAGNAHGLGLKSDGSIYAWGYNENGRLGLGWAYTPSGRLVLNRGDAYVAVPTRIGTDNDWVFVSAGYNHSLALKSDGSLYAWGANTYAQLGDQSGDACVPVKISSGWGYSSPVIAAELNGGGDYDGDGKTDFVVYDASTGNWTVRLSGAGYALYSLPALLGGPGYKLVTADFDGDGKTDPAVYNESTGTWLVKMSGSGYAQETTVFGGSGYTAVPADYDGDGMAGYAVYNKTTGEWRIYLTGSAYTVLKTGMWAGCVPVPMDYNGDMIAELALYESATGNWQIMLGDTVVSLPSFLGGNNYLAVPMDYDGDRLADPAVYEQSTGVWKIKLSSAGYWTLDSSLYGWSLGGTGYMPTPADYDGDRLADPTVYGLTNGYWFIMASRYGYITIVPVW